MNTTLTTPEFKKRLASLFVYLANHLGIRQVPKAKFVNSKQNADNPFGLTGHYDHTNHLITVYITDRHDTDILRSFAHEVIHHWQNERGVLYSPGTPINNNGEHYAQYDFNLRKRELEAFLYGSILMRDWQDENRYGPPLISPILPSPYD